jgi:nucleoside-diphosphate-sugar epimerase
MTAAGAPRLVVRGDTSFVGRALIELTRSRGHQVAMFNRGTTYGSPTETVRDTYNWWFRAAQEAPLAWPTSEEQLGTRRLTSCQTA